MLAVYNVNSLQGSLFINCCRFIYHKIYFQTSGPQSGLYLPLRAVGLPWKANRVLEFGPSERVVR
jgi:hypothetical protein